LGLGLRLGLGIAYFLRAKTLSEKTITLVKG
jgi:hypothetical protein